MARSKAATVEEGGDAGEKDAIAGVSAPLSRAAMLIDVVAAAPEGLTLNRIAEEAGLPVSTTHRLVRSLVAIEYLAMDADRKMYQIGRRLTRVFRAAFGPVDMQAISEPVLSRLVQKFGQVFYLDQLVGARVRLVAYVLPSSGRRSLIVPGEFSPVHATAAGKAIIAHESEAAIERHLRRPLEKFQPATITDPERLRREFELTRQRGYALSQAEFDAGVTALAVPVSVAGAGVVFALGTAGLSESMFERHSLETFVRAAREAAKELQARLSPVTAGRH
jgi:DNA-binding IclR family transcriptional regulator